MAEAVHNDGEILQPLPEDEEDLQFLQNANAHGIIDWINDN